MTTKTIERKVNDLSKEVANLRSLVISVVTSKDPEGEYKPSFVKRVLKSMKDSGPIYKYQGKGSFLKQLKELK